MSNVLRLAIVDPNDRTREELKAMLLGMDRVWLEAECSRYEFFCDIIEPTTGETYWRHHVSPDGYYRGRKVLPDAEE